MISAGSALPFAFARRAVRGGRALALFGLFAWSFGAVAHELNGTVIGVMDGDTIDVINKRREVSRIRLAVIDAPEKGQAFGQSAKRALSDLVFSQPVSVTWRKTDRYGRLVGVVRVRDLDVGLRMIELGLAWYYRRYQSEQEISDRLRYARAEERARAGGLGLWSEAEPVPPWMYRLSRRSCGSDIAGAGDPRHRKPACQRRAP